MESKGKGTRLSFARCAIDYKVLRLKPAVFIMMTFIRGLAVVFGLLISLPTAFAQSPAQKSKDCLIIDDMTKERLDCFDAIVAPQPDAKKAKKKAAGMRDCRFLKEEDERLMCFNKFAETRPKPAAKKKKIPAAAPAQ
jgi:hypothetical protein